MSGRPPLVPHHRRGLALFQSALSDCGFSEQEIRQTDALHPRVVLERRAQRRGQTERNRKHEFQPDTYWPEQSQQGANGKGHGFRYHATHDIPASYEQPAWKNKYKELAATPRNFRPRTLSKVNVAQKIKRFRDVASGAVAGQPLKSKLHPHIPHDMRDAGRIVLNLRRILQLRGK